MLKRNKCFSPKYIYILEMIKSSRAMVGNRDFFLRKVLLVKWSQAGPIIALYFEILHHPFDRGRWCCDICQNVTDVAPSCGWFLWQILHESFQLIIYTFRIQKVISCLFGFVYILWEISTCSISYVGNLFIANALHWTTNIKKMLNVNKPLLLYVWHCC